MALETLAPTTDRRFGSRAERIDWGGAEPPASGVRATHEGDGAAPDTIREPEEVVGGTVPMAALEPKVFVNQTAPLAVVAPAIHTAPLEEPVRVSTEPLAMPAHAREALTYEIYTPDDTLRGRPAVRFDEGHARRRRIALGVLAFAVAIATTLAAIGSLEEAPTGRVETTSAMVTPTVTTLAPTASATENATANTTPTITFAPPLSPVPSAPRRRNLPRPLPKRLP